MPSGGPRRLQRAWDCRSCYGGQWHGHAPGPPAAAEVERERIRELARIGSNLNQIARWANTHKGNVEAVEVIAHLVAIERALDIVPAQDQEQDQDQEKNPILRLFGRPLQVVKNK